MVALARLLAAQRPGARARGPARSLGTRHGRARGDRLRRGSRQDRHRAGPPRRHRRRAANQAVAFVRQHYDSHAVETPWQTRYVARFPRTAAGRPALTRSAEAHRTSEPIQAWPAGRLRHGRDEDRIGPGAVPGGNRSYATAKPASGPADPDPDGAFPKDGRGRRRTPAASAQRVRSGSQPQPVPSRAGKAERKTVKIGFIGGSGRTAIRNHHPYSLTAGARTHGTFGLRDHWVPPEPVISLSDGRTFGIPSTFRRQCPFRSLG
jgi:hypothetical protein